MARKFLFMVLLSGLLPLAAVTLVWLILARGAGGGRLDAPGALLALLAGLAVHMAILLGALLVSRQFGRTAGPDHENRQDKAGPNPPTALAPIDRLARAFALERRDLRGAALKRFLLYAMPREPRPVPVDINAAIGVCIEAIRATSSRGAGPALTFDPAPDAGHCACDADQLHQVLLNLILNARDAAGPSGIVRVRTQRLDGEILVAVRDTGPGVPLDEVEGLFDRPFVTAKPRALGLGLATCRRIVREHGGVIEALNVLPHGLEVGVRLKSLAAEPRAAAGRPRSGRAA